MAYAHVDRNKRKKFDFKSWKTVFARYPDGTKGFELYNLSSGSFIRSRDMIFAENSFYDFAGETKQQADLLFPDTWQPEDSTENEMINGDTVNFD